MRTRSALFVLALLIALPVWAATQAPDVTTAPSATLDAPEPAAADAVSPELAATVVSTEAFLDGLSQEADARAAGWSLPSCQAYNGTYCASGSSYFRCQHTPSEPGICICQNNTWHCA